MIFRFELYIIFKDIMMKNILLLFTIISFLLVSCGDDDSPSTPTNDNPMMPLALGNEWHYDFEYEKFGLVQSSDYRTKIEETKNIYHKSNKVTAYKFMVYIDEVLQDSLWMFEQDLILYQVPDIQELNSSAIVQNDLTIEKAKSMSEITYDNVSGTISTEMQEIMSKEQEVIKIVTHSEKNGETIDKEVWYIPEIGLAKDVHDFMGINNSYKQTMTLKSYTLN